MKTKSILDKPKSKRKKAIPRAKPITKSVEIEDEILSQMMEGKSLRSICRAKTMPTLRTVLRWVRDDAEFMERYQVAQAVRSELMVDGIVELSKKAKDINSAAGIRVQIDAIKWAAAHMKPKRFGDKIDITSDGEKMVTGISLNITYPKKELDSGA